jgi:hypothetical protein
MKKHVVMPSMKFVVFLWTLAILGFLSFLPIAPQISPAFAAPGDINYNKTAFHPGETIYFNLGDEFYRHKLEDVNKYAFPHLWQDKDMKKGEFIRIENRKYWVNVENQGMTDVIEQVAVIKTWHRGEPWIIRRPIIKTIPQQRLLLLNW